MAITAGSLSVIRSLPSQKRKSLRGIGGRSTAGGVVAPDCVVPVLSGRFRPVVGRGRPALPPPGGFRPGNDGGCGGSARGFGVPPRLFGPATVTGSPSRPPVAHPSPECWPPPWRHPPTPLSMPTATNRSGPATRRPGSLRSVQPPPTRVAGMSGGREGTHPPPADARVCDPAW